MASDLSDQHDNTVREGDEDVGDVICYERPGRRRTNVQPFREVHRASNGSKEGRAEGTSTHRQSYTNPSRRSSRVLEVNHQYDAYELDSACKVGVEIRKRKRPSPRVIPQSTALQPSRPAEDRSSSPLSPVPPLSELKSDAPHVPPRQKSTSAHIPPAEIIPAKRAKGTYSSWSCQKAPPNILSLLRFDHPPELLNLPSGATVQESYKRAQLGQPGRTKGERSVGEKRYSVARQGGVRVIDRSGIARDIVSIRRNAREKGQGKFEGQGELGIVPLPQTPFDPCRADGIPSSTFCKVLRILAHLSTPRSSDKEIIPPPRNKPPVWAESRQELCEALPYYRSFQSGLYMHKRVAYGYLLEAFPAPRDIWAQNGRVIISHGGGQCIRTLNPDGTPGPATLQADQSRSDARVDTLLLAYEKRTPIVLIAGKGYEELPWELDCAYVVLGWYWISLTWVEAEPPPLGVPPPDGRDYFHRVKIRFDWVESQGKPWWIDSDTNTNNIIGTNEPEIVPDTGWSRESLPLTPLPSEIEDYDTASPKKSRQGDAALTPSAKMDVSCLLNPSGLLTPPNSSPERPNEVDRTLSPLKKPPRFSAPREYWPGERSLPPSKPLLTVDKYTLNRSLFSSPMSCRECHKPIIKIYQQGLICLRPECKAFFMLDTHLGFLPIPPGFLLSYDDKFLKSRSTPAEVRIPYEVVPLEPVRTVPEAETGGREGEVGGRTLWRGWVCKNCGRANCRYRWEVWECRNCGNTLAPNYPARIVIKRDLPSILPSFLGDAKIDASSGITSAMKWIREIGCVCLVYDLPSAGKVYHLVQLDLKTADNLLEEYQEAANEGGWFQRRPLKGTDPTYHELSLVKGQFLAQHFAVNFGASYKYQVDTLSYPFEQSPECVTRSLELITQRVKLILGEEVNFNEILSVMYREGQKMSWHDDGEAGLGPVVSSLSLGNQAIMSFRLKTPRSNLNQSFYTGVTSESKKVPPTALSFMLSHGDIMIMQGRDIQKKYDHKVVPMGFRIASTARVIGPGEA
uniref:Alpha-ketoglutarate-dependent dioxygenase AlkB-like domain-containing protein n=1 Tax=Kwoniella bestiolae CBS 10118 TaxID=1296100 RepID=A0A1B9GDP3_9TREE|nr:hypothetical protein I302_00647 [Kwoniella bestiolae CBS 10118]OCF29152.1 hypothetical protein I302_00647 [Kwoniella bestiolae CBS 10118]